MAVNGILGIGIFGGNALRRRNVARGTWIAIGLLCATVDAGAQPSGPDGFIPIPPGELEARLKAAGFDIVKVEGAGGGVTGAKKIELKHPDDGFEITVKWKPVPGTGDGWNNSPRKEIAAYEIQKWFLDPVDYVVPVTVAACPSLERYRAIDPDPKPNLGHFECVLGVESVWLDHVTVPDELYSKSRFAADPAYARHIAQMNLLTYLIGHKDGREGNFLTSKDETDRRAFAVDNGISFGALVQNWFVRNWHKIRVPAVPADAIDRLRALRTADYDALGTLAELRADARGQLRNTVPSENLDPDSGARITAERIQLGLTRAEIAAVRERVEKLLERVDDEDLETF